MDRLTDALELAGILLVIAAIGLFVAQAVSLPAGMAVVGVLLFGASWLVVTLGRRAGRRAQR